MFNKIYEKIKQIIIDYYIFLIAVIVLIFLFNFELPYVVYRPGGIVSLKQRIEVEDYYKYDGDLSMSYVTLMKGNIPTVLFSYIIPNWDIVKKSDIVSDDKSVNDLIKLEKIYLSSALDNATIIAYRKAQKDIDINKTISNVILVRDDAKTDIQVTDKIIKVDGKEINNINDIRKIVEKHNVRDKIEIEVLSNNKKVTRHATVYEIDNNKIIGIAAINTYEYNTNPKIKIKTKANESGSSGGLMMSLAIYNSLVKEDITHGKNIVGTGTIEIDGTVGEIDGVKYKLLGAVKNKADIFLCPKENYKEAMKVKKKNNLDIIIKKVTTFDSALDYLNTLD